MNPSITALPSSLEELEAGWTRLLEDIVKEIRCPEDPAQLMEKLKADQAFMDLINGWENMPSAAQANAWEMIQDRLWETAIAQRRYCIRCGECCRRGSPGIHDQDRPALADGVISRADLVTLRRGEKAFSNRLQKMVVLEQEQIKLKETEGRTCLFLGPGGDACLIYQDRPFQCRVMECWDRSRFQTVLSLPPLTRLDLLGQDNPLSLIIMKHEETASVALLAEALTKLAEGDPSAEEKALEIILFDLHARDFCQQKFGLSPEEMDFFLGRPLSLICQGFGFNLVLDAQERASLAPMKSTR